ncbi:MAG: undecaprenyl-phosphate glucose phosphotransferase [Pseudomonadota bacterium]
MSTVYPMHRAVTTARRQPRALRPVHVLSLWLRFLDLAAIVIAAWLANLLFGGGGLAKSETLFVGVTLLAVMSVASAFGLYEARRLGELSFQLLRAWGAWFVTMAAAVSLVVILRPEELPQRDWLLAWFMIALGLIGGIRFATKMWVAKLRRAGDYGWNLVVVGSGHWGPQARQRLDVDPLQSRVVGYVSLDHCANLDDALLELRRQLADKPIDQVALALDPSQTLRIPELLDVLRSFPVEVGLVPEPTPANLPTIGCRRLGDLTTITCLEKPIDGWSWHVKSAVDRVAAAIILVFLAPLLLVVAGLVAFTSPGPVFFRQKRLGFNQQLIDVFKFRSMYVDLCDAPVSNEIRQATKNDPRVTPVGRWLRRTSLDELPQLINVLRGEMSLVGPRPHAVAHDEYYAKLIDGYLGRHRAKPGITGWAQINGCRGEIHSLEDMRRRIELDLYYIDNWSLWFDLRILMRTTFVFFKDEQAY